MRPIHLLIVEDNPGHARLVMMALEEQPWPVTADWVADGDEAIAYLQRQVQFADRHELDLVLLDLRLPTISGLEVLNEIKGRGHLKSLPVVMFSTSSSEADRQAAEGAGAVALLSKPLNLEDWGRMMRWVIETCCRRVLSLNRSETGRRTAAVLSM